LRGVTLFGRPGQTRKSPKSPVLESQGRRSRAREPPEPPIGRTQTSEESRMGPRSIANYVFIVVLAGLLAGGLYATWNMFQAVMLGGS